METITQSRARRRKRVINIEASREWVDWVDGLAERAGASRSTIIDQALRRLAMQLKYETLPPKR